MSKSKTRVPALLLACICLLTGTLFACENVPNIPDVSGTSSGEESSAGSRNVSFLPRSGWKHCPSGIIQVMSLRLRRPRRALSFLPRRMSRGLLIWPQSSVMSLWLPNMV